MFVKIIPYGKNHLARRRGVRKGSALVEYGLLISGVALIGLAAISVFGHKVTDLYATMAAVLPGSHQDDNHPIQSGHLIETSPTGDGSLAIDPAKILAANGTARLNANVFGNAGELGLVTESGANLTPGK